jgi:hypothetical protein
MLSRRKKYEKKRNIEKNAKTKRMKRAAKMALVTGLLGRFAEGFKLPRMQMGNKYKPHQGVEECRRRREQMGTMEYAP